MESDNTMTTLSEVTNKLAKDGYTTEFKMNEKKFINAKTGKEYKPADLIIDKVFRFEGESNPDDMSVLYAISANDGTKGMLIDAYGAYGSYDSQALAEFLKQIKEKE